MKTGSGEEEKKYEVLGRAIVLLAYLRRALIWVLALSLIALVVLMVWGKPLWWAPVIGLGVFLIVRGIRRLIFSLVIRYARWASGEK